MKMYDSDKHDSDITAIGNNVEQYTMGVVVSSKVFSMNIDGIYQDKYGSTVRELSSNALDIHKKCGIADKPFDIHIPSELTGKFIIRDYGCGLTKEDVIEYFGKLFSSSKDQENESVGFFGIGCKSPFTVTDDFLVVSIHNHIKTEYAFSRENKGTPRCIVLSSKPTDEPSGISIIIDSGETDVWLGAIRNQLMMFPTKPNVYMDGELIDVGYYELKSYGGVHYGKGLPKTIYINQGGVIYPIDRDQFPDVEFRTPQSSSSFVIYTCDIGMITVPPDRERIEISKSNIDNLKQIVDAANLEIDGDVCKYFFSNYTDSYPSLNSICMNQVNLINIRSIIKSKLENPIYTPEVSSLISKDGFYSTLVTRLDRWYGEYTYFKSYPTLYVCLNGRYSRKKYSNSNMIEMFTSSNAAIIVIDNTSTITSAYDLYGHKFSSVYIFRCKKGKADLVVKLLEAYQSYFKSSQKVIKIDNATVKISKKEAQDKAIKNKAIVNTRKFYTLCCRNPNLYNLIFNNVSVELSPKETDDFYIMEINPSLSQIDGIYYNSTLQDLLNIITSGLLDKPIYFMKRQHFLNFKYGTKITFDELIVSQKDNDTYYDLVFGKRKWKWSNKFSASNQAVIREKINKSPKDTIGSICTALSIDLSVRTHLLNEVISKVDIFTKMGADNINILNNINISPKGVRSVIKQYFIKENSQ